MRPTLESATGWARKEHPAHVRHASGAPLIYRYFGFEIAKLFGVMLVSVLGLYLLVEFADKVDNFMYAGIGIRRMLVFLACKTPSIVFEIAPIVYLFSVLGVCCQMRRRNEFTALSSCGIQLRGLVKPVLLMAVVLGVVLGAASETIIPQTMARANAVWDMDIRKKSTLADNHYQSLWLKNGSSIMSIAYCDIIQNSLTGITLHVFDEEFRLIKRIDAPNGAFRNGQVMLYDSIERDYQPPLDPINPTASPTPPRMLDFSLETFSLKDKKAVEMSSWELFQHIVLLEKAGYNTTSRRIHLYNRGIGVLAILVMGLLAAAIGLNDSLNIGTAKRITLGIVGLFVYWVMHSFCVTLGHAEMLPPMAAAAITALLWSSASIVALVHTDI